MGLRLETLEKYVELARRILIEVAKGKRRDRSITYKGLMGEMGGPGRGYIGEVLEAICQAEHREKRPLLSALVVHSNDRLPGDAFWKLSVVPPHIRTGSKEEKKKFWKNECDKLYKRWGNE
ncbi:hypothetical protein ES703_111766 [subsurface metagenome]